VGEDPENPPIGLPIVRHEDAEGVLVGFLDPGTSEALALIGALRFTVDRFRYYEPSATLVGSPINTWLSLLLIVMGMAIVWQGRVSRRTD
jgi:hypothetical protein